MTNTLSGFDWSLVQSFLAVAETGSLSAAGRDLGVSQPTLGRRILALEQSLGASLFQRQPSGMALTPQGQTLLPHARAMQAAAHALGLVAAGEETALAGSVRITASEMISHHVLPPILAELRATVPEIQIELVPTDATHNLLFREADIAVRMYRPEQLDMVARHIGDIPIGLFGASRYLDRRGRPRTRDDLRQHDIVGFDRSDQIVEGFRAVGWAVSRDWFPLRCDSNAVYWELVRAGCGLGFSQGPLGRADPKVEQIDIDLGIPPLPVWLTTHERIRRTPRIGRVWDHLAEGLSHVVS